jgi:hypothetical protein
VVVVYSIKNATTKKMAQPKTTKKNKSQTIIEEFLKNDFVIALVELVKLINNLWPLIEEYIKNA